ncbi:MAG TPA: hypothetical protein VN605_02215, partial [Thermoanaerobaculia bacterium]|nr:hypothetical protein [Thermoanaerobaculia bacterium]
MKNASRRLRREGVLFVSDLRNDAIDRFRSVGRKKLAPASAELSIPCSARTPRDAVDFIHAHPFVTPAALHHSTVLRSPSANNVS